MFNSYAQLNIFNLTGTDLI